MQKNNTTLLRELANHLSTKKLGSTIQYEPTVSSTQTLAHAWAKDNAPEGAIVLTEEQTDGKGRSSKAWFSPYGEGIWASLILRPPIPIQDATHFTLLTSLAIKRGLQSLLHLPIQIKWPNDLLIHDKKVCGVLTEVRSYKKQLNYMIIGMGLNVNTSLCNWPKALQERATSLSIESGLLLSRGEILAAILREIETWYEIYLENGFNEIKEAWEAHSNMLGRRIMTRSAMGCISGVALHLTDKGELVIQTKQGKVPICSPIIHLC